MGIDKNLFLGANTADGFVGFYDKVIGMYNLKKLYILKGGSGIGKSTFINNFAKEFSKHDRDFLICSGDPKSLDGVIIPDLRIGIIDGTAPHAIDPKYPGVIDEIVNLGEFIDPARITADRATLEKLYAKKADFYRAATENLAAARRVHHEIEALYAGAVDFAGVDERLAGIIASVSAMS